MEEALKSFSTQLEKTKKEIEENASKTKANFNVFDSLTRHHLEELHSNFIAYLLDPKASHDCGDWFLIKFIDLLKTKIPDANIGYNTNSTKARVYREKSFKDGENDGRIDIHLELDKNVIIIENKIYAREQHIQLKRYFNYYNKAGRNPTIIYLTIDGKLSEQAVSKDNEDTPYYCLSYKEDIINWLIDCLSKVSDYPKPHAGITFYKEMIEKSILHIQDKLITAMEELLKKQEYEIIIREFNNIEKAYNTIYSNSRTSFFEQLYNILRENYSVVPTAWLKEQTKESTYNWYEISNKIYGGLRINNHTKNLVYKIPNTNYQVIFMIEHDIEDLYYGLVIVDNNYYIQKIRGDAELTKIANIITEKLNPLKLQDNERWWFAWKYFDNLKYDSADFTIELKNLDQCISRCFKEIEEYAKVWESLIIELNKAHV